MAWLAARRAWHQISTRRHCCYLRALLHLSVWRRHQRLNIGAKKSVAALKHGARSGETRGGALNGVAANDI